MARFRRMIVVVIVVIVAVAPPRDLIVTTQTFFATPRDLIVTTQTFFATPPDLSLTTQHFSQLSPATSLRAMKRQSSYVLASAHACNDVRCLDARCDCSEIQPNQINTTFRTACKAYPAARLSMLVHIFTNTLSYVFW